MRIRVFVGLWIIHIVLSTAVFAQVVSGERAGELRPPEPASSTTEARLGSGPSAFDRYVVRGGWVTVGLLIPLSVTTVALMLQYFITIRRGTIIPQATARELVVLLENKQYLEAVRAASEGRAAICKIIHAGLKASGSGLAGMEQAMQQSIEEHATRFHQRVEHLNLIGSLSPMLGLLGTVHGIIGMFISISDAGGVPVMARISHDLGSALVATFWGLVIAIPSLAAFGWFRNRIDVWMRECAGACEGVLGMFAPEAGSTEPAVRAERKIAGVPEAVSRPTA